MLSLTTEYALRALTHLAQHCDHSPVSGKELAQKTAVPANYLSKILLCLRNGGFVATARGSGGGYWLVRPPGTVSLNQIVALFDGPAKRSCLLGTNKECNDRTPCSAHAAWRNARLYYEHFLETTTLADIAGGPAPQPKVRRAHAGGRP